MINCGAAPRPQRLFASNRLQEGPVVRKRPEAKQARRGLTARPPQPTRVTSEGSQKAVKGRNAMFDFVGSHAAHWSRTSSAHCPFVLDTATMRQVDLVARLARWLYSCIDDDESMVIDVLVLHV